MNPIFVMRRIQVEENLVTGAGSVCGYECFSLSKDR